MSKEVKEESRKEAIAKAIDTATEKEETKEEIKETKEEQEIKEELEEEEIDPAELDNALKLFRALNDPETGPSIIKVMAEKAGISSDSTKKEVKAAAKTINDVVMEKLGPDFSVLGGKLSEILETVVPAIVAQVAKPIQERTIATEQAQIKRELGIALDASFNKYDEVPEKVQRKVSALVDEMPPKPGTDPEKYFDRIVKIAANELEIELKPRKIKEESSEKKQEKIVRNKRDAFSRLASEGTAEVKEGQAAPKEYKSRKAAIEDAMAAVEKKYSK